MLSLGHSLNAGAAASGNFLMSTGGWLCHHSLWSRRRKQCAHLYHETINWPKKPHLVMALKWCTESDETRLLFIAIITQLRNICLREIIEQSRCFTSSQWLLVTSALVLCVWGTNKNAADGRDRREKLQLWLCQLKYCTQLIKIGQKSQSESRSSGRSFLYSVCFCFFQKTYAKKV